MKSVKAIIVVMVAIASAIQAQNSLAGTDLKFRTTDTIFSKPYIDKNEFRDNPAKVRQSFNFDWKFILNDSIDASSGDFNDSYWENIQLPHDWSITLPLIEPAPGQRNLGSMGFMQGGTGWPTAWC